MRDAFATSSLSNRQRRSDDCGRSTEREEARRGVASCCATGGVSALHSNLHRNHTQLAITRQYLRENPRFLPVLARLLPSFRSPVRVERSPACVHLCDRINARTIC